MEGGYELDKIYLVTQQSGLRDSCRDDRDLLTELSDGGGGIAGQFPGKLTVSLSSKRIFILPEEPAAPSADTIFPR